MGSEKNFENHIKDYLTSSECWFVKYWGGGQFTKSGVPDILCCCNGKFIGIEVKAEKGKPSELQLHNLKKIDDACGFAILLYPDHWEVFKNFIDCLKANDPNLWYNYKILSRRWMNETTSL